ncbi:MAG: hypothetical protein WAL79_03850 [Nitrososphaeraceae archaeon]
MKFHKLINCINQLFDIKNSIDIMLKKKIRNLVVSPAGDYDNNNGNYIVNDRMILEYIFSYEGRKIMT